MIDVLAEYKERPGACAECGNSPVNHFLTYSEQTLTVAIGKFVRKVRGRYFVVVLDALFARLEPLIYLSLIAIPGVRFAKDAAGAASYRSQVIWEEAQKRGIAMEQLRIWGRATELYRARIRDRWYYFQSLPTPHSTDSVADITDDKDALARELQKRGIPTPRSVSVTTLKSALSAFKSFDGPVVVKPQSGSRGRHTTVNVKNASVLEAAFCSAQRLCHWVVIETYLQGSVCRGTVVDGTLAGFLQGFSPHVTGDGTSSIQELITEANAQKPERVKDIVITDEHTAFLHRMGYTLDSVLPTGKTISLTHRTGRLFGGKTRELVNSVHPKLRAYIERAAVVTRIPVVGFDLIIQDPEQNPDEQRWGIIEGNGLPYIDLHYLPLEGQPSRVAERVWDYVEVHLEMY